MDQKQQIADRLKQANNILVTVSNNPSVDQLAACIGLTLALNKMGKHATAVFSGAVPNTIEFLQPEDTLETNTDSLRDFIISLDKSKADKLRYKVEDKVVKIFITPYRTSISDKDLEFSQGDFNVDVVIALGVHDQGELDQAITSHGRILHDAAVVTVNVNPGGELGSINWLVPAASSLSELVVDLVDSIDKQMVDGQMATALLTGIVAETARFSNEKTSPDTMSISARLMAAGADQQLVATKLEEAAPPPAEPEQPPPLPEQAQEGESQAAEAPAEAGQDGTLEIEHEDKPNEEDRPVGNVDDLDSSDNQDNSNKPEETPKIHIDDQGALRNIKEAEEAQKAEEAKAEESSIDPAGHVGGSRMILQPPSMGGTMSASGNTDENYNDPLSLPQPSDQRASGEPAPFASPASATISASPVPYMPPSMTPGPPPPSADPPATPSAVDSVIGASSSSAMPVPMPPSAPPAVPPADPAVATDSPALGAPAANDPATSLFTPFAPPVPDAEHVGNARDAVTQALASQALDRPEPIKALNAQPLGDPLHSPPAPPSDGPPDLNIPVPADTPQSVQPSGLNMPAPVGAPPPVPPPMMPQQ